uniref:Gamma-tubulin complex component n=3 Tax=Macrostomum lignano TaxID=282301 RepID=A0A1I8H2W9_9PLAT
YIIFACNELTMVKSKDFGLYFSQQMADINHARVQLTHHVSSLFSQILGADKPSVELDTYIDLLERSVRPNTQSLLADAHRAKRIISDNNPHAEEFNRKYEELKIKNVKELDPFVDLLSRIKRDPATQRTLEAIAGPVQLPTSAGSAAAQPRRPQTAVGAPAGSTSRLNVAALSSHMNAEARQRPTDSSLPSSVAGPLRQKTPASEPAEVPWQPDWLYERPFLSSDFVLDDPPRRLTPSIGVYPVEAQEQLIIQDVLSLLSGVEGSFVVPRPLASRADRRGFDVDNSLDATRLEMLGQLLPVCSHRSDVTRFAEDKAAYEYGMVNQALSGSITALLRDLGVLVCQLEHQQRIGQLRLHRLHCCLQEPARVLETLAEIAHDVNQGECLGGSVLSLLHDKACASAGDPKRHRLLLHLTKAASRPFFDMLQTWVYRGRVLDPYSEFMVTENTATSKEVLTREYINDYWENRYQLCSQRVPSFLWPMAEKVLSTGKYLNVVAQCGEALLDYPAEELVYAYEGGRYVEQLESAHAKAAALLMRLLREKGLRDLLCSLKRFFLLDQSDFLVHFMDLADSEMRREAGRVSLNRLESLLETAVRTSAAGPDPNRDRLRVALLPHDLIGQMLALVSLREAAPDATAAARLTALEAFSLDIEVDFPLSLLINRRAITRYQMLFRHLFYCRHVERLLGSVWLQQHRNRASVTSAYALRQQMLTFVQHLEYYMTFEVIEPAWHRLWTQLDKVGNLDELIERHSHMLTSCLSDCMLQQPDLLKLLYKLLAVCVTFCNCIARHGGSAESADLAATVETFSANFSGLLKQLIEAIAEHCSNQRLNLMNLIYRLNYNYFYVAAS